MEKCPGGSLGRKPTKKSLNEPLGKPGTRSRGEKEIKKHLWAVYVGQGPFRASSKTTTKIVSRRGLGGVWAGGLIKN